MRRASQGMWHGKYDMLPSPVLPNSPHIMILIIRFIPGCFAQALILDTVMIFGRRIARRSC